MRSPVAFIIIVVDVFFFFLFNLVRISHPTRVSIFVRIIIHIVRPFFFFFSFSLQSAHRPFKSSSSSFRLGFFSLFLVNFSGKRRRRRPEFEYAFNMLLFRRRPRRTTLPDGGDDDHNIINWHICVGQKQNAKPSPSV